MVNPLKNTNSHTVVSRGKAVAYARVSSATQLKDVPLCQYGSRASVVQHRHGSLALRARRDEGSRARGRAARTLYPIGRDSTGSERRRSA